MERTPPFKKGDRIKLNYMANDPDPIPAGTTGTVESCSWFQNSWQVWVDWDINDRNLALVMPPDSAHKI